MLVPIFASQKKSKEDFHFYEKRQKSEIVFIVCSELLEAVHTEVTLYIISTLHSYILHHCCFYYMLVVQV